MNFSRISVRRNATRGILSLLFFFGFTIVAFQNCGQQFNAIESGSKVGSSSAPGIPVRDIQLSFSPSSIIFQEVAPGMSSADLDVEIRNNGSVPVDIVQISSAGSNAEEFIVTANNCGGSSLQIGSICTARVKFSPASSAAGDRMATMEVQLASGHSFSLPMTGRASASGGLTLSSQAIDFGEANVEGQTVERELTLQNSSTSVVSLSGFQITTGESSDFTIQANSCGSSLASGANCVVKLKFDPSAPNERRSQLSFMAAGMQKLVSLRGVGKVAQGGACTPGTAEPSVSGSSSGSLYSFNFSATAMGGNKSCMQGSYFVLGKVPSGGAVGWWVFRPTSPQNLSVGTWEQLTNVTDLSVLDQNQIMQKIQQLFSNQPVVEIKPQVTLLNATGMNMSELPGTEIYVGFGIGATPQSAWDEMNERTRFFKIATAPAAERFSAEALSNNDLMSYDLSVKVNVDSSDVNQMGHFFVMAEAIHKTTSAKSLFWVKKGASSAAEFVELSKDANGNYNFNSVMGYDGANAVALVSRGYGSSAAMVITDNFDVRGFLNEYNLNILVGYGRGQTATNSLTEMLANTEYTSNVIDINGQPAKGRWVLARSLSSNSAGNVNDFQFGVSGLSGPLQRKSFNLSAKFASADEGRWGAVYVVVNYNGKLYFLRKNAPVVEYTSPSQMASKDVSYDRSFVRLKSSDYSNFSGFVDADLREFAGSAIWVGYGVAQSSTVNSAMPTDNTTNWQAVWDDLSKFRAPGYSAGRYRDVHVLEKLNTAATFTATGSASGNLSSYSLTARMTVAYGDYFKKGYAFACANLNNTWVCLGQDGQWKEVVLTGTNWVIKNTTTMIPAVRNCNILADCDSNLANVVSLPYIYPLAQNANFTGLAGTKVFMAYGIGGDASAAFNELLAAQRAKEIATLPSN